MKETSAKCKRLFICMTPLHILIAEKIIERKKIEDFALVYYYYRETDKLRHYYDRLAKRARYSFFIKKHRDFLTSLVTLCKLSNRLRRCFHREGTVYCGNIKTIYSRLPVWLVGAKSLHTFDDGIGNVFGQGYFYEGREPALLNRALGLLGLNFSYSHFYRLIKKHYTIYNGHNAMLQTEYLPVFDFSARTDPGSSKGEVAVLLTSTNHEEGMMDLETEKRLYRSIINDFRVKYYIPHPMEQTQKVDGTGVEKIHSHKIAEEIIMDLRNQYSKVTVIGWFSSVLVHLARVEGITAINIIFHPTKEMAKPIAFFESQNVKSYTPSMNS